MSLSNVCQKLKVCPSEGESGRIRENHSAILPHVTTTIANDLGTQREKRENSQQSYTCAGAHARTRARAVALAAGYSPYSGVSMPPPAPATVLKNCRCRDCRRWDDAVGQCEVSGLVRYVPREDYEPLVRQFWSDLGMIRPQQWHYCADYRGPQISKDVVWSKQPVPP